MSEQMIPRAAIEIELAENGYIIRTFSPMSYERMVAVATTDTQLLAEVKKAAELQRAKPQLNTTGLAQSVMSGMNQSPLKKPMFPPAPTMVGPPVILGGGGGGGISSP